MLKWTVALFAAAILLAGGSAYFVCHPASTIAEIQEGQTPVSKTPLSVSDLLATVTVSGSTNTLPYSIMIFADGSATLSYEAQAALNLKPKAAETEKFGPGSVDVKTLQALLQNVGDVSLLTEGQPCGKPVSFATTKRITYHGKTSGDISCPSKDWPQAGQKLKNFIDRLLISKFRSRIPSRE
jgi:hypothetical protein